jgi:hypothetical protein
LDLGIECLVTRGPALLRREFLLVAKTFPLERTLLLELLALHLQLHLHPVA